MVAQFGSYLRYHPKLKNKNILVKKFIWFFGSPMTGTSFYHWKKTTSSISFTSVLDAGCGNGEYALYMADKYPNCKIDAIDIEKDKIIYCNELLKKINKLNLQFIQNDLVKLDFKEKYDFIYSNHVIEHLDPRSQKVFLKTLFSALKPKGYLYIVRPSPDQKRYLCKKLNTEYEEWAEREHIGVGVTKEQTIDMIKEVGFNVVASEYINGFLGELSFEIKQFFFKKSNIAFALLLPLLRTLNRFDLAMKHSYGNCFVILSRK